MPNVTIETHRKHTVHKYSFCSFYLHPRYSSTDRELKISDPLARLTIIIIVILLARSTEIATFEVYNTQSQWNS